ncbi:hypothetical protein EMMF5_001686 [Cystobasidiomycetes sp. EMM_F5]
MTWLAAQAEFSLRTAATMPITALAIITGLLPTLDGAVCDYISSFESSDDLTSEDSEEELRDFVRPLLEGEGVEAEEVEAAIEQIRATRSHLHGQDGDEGVAGPSTGGARRLEKAVDMKNNPAISFTASLANGPVDIESTTKARSTQVDLKKLEKAEAKIRAKMEKRSRRTVEFEGSKLVDAAKAQQAYEDMYMKVNPLQSAANKGKSKDIHLDAIDVNFGSNQILMNASLTLAHGRRYGLIGRNGVGKSTLLRAMSLREVPIPGHITILSVEQEVLGDDTPALDSVLQADVWRDKLLKEEKELNTTLIEVENLANATEDTADVRKAKRQRDDATTRLGEVQQLLVEMEADTAQSRAAALLAGLGFSQEDQSRPTRTFSGGWRMRLSLARALFCKPDLLVRSWPVQAAMSADEYRRCWMSLRITWISMLWRGWRTIYRPGRILYWSSRTIELSWTTLRQTSVGRGSCSEYYYI